MGMTKNLGLNAQHRLGRQNKNTLFGQFNKISQIIVHVMKRSKSPQDVVK